MMLMVAIAGVILGMGAYIRRLMTICTVYRSKAAYFGEHEREYRLVLKSLGDFPDPWMTEQIGRWARLRKKYETAATRPWVPLADDPPKRHIKLDNATFKHVPTTHRPPSPEEPIPPDDDPDGW